jgi:hypothetical protein
MFSTKCEKENHTNINSSRHNTEIHVCAFGLKDVCVIGVKKGGTVQKNWHDPCLGAAMHCFLLGPLLTVSLLSNGVTRRLTKSAKRFKLGTVSFVSSKISMKQSIPRVCFACVYDQG